MLEVAAMGIRLAVVCLFPPIYLVVITNCSIHILLCTHG